MKSRPQCGADDVVVGILLGQTDPDVWQCVRNARLAGFCGANCHISCAHSIRAVRSIAISMKKLMPIPKKNDNRGAKSSIF
jgi:hypothetical protein